MDEADLKGIILLCEAALASSVLPCALCKGATGTPESYKPSINPKHSLRNVRHSHILDTQTCFSLLGGLTFAGSDVVHVQLVALLGALQGAFGSKEVAGGLVCLVVSSADLGVVNVRSFKCDIAFVPRLYPDKI